MRKPDVAGIADERPGLYLAHILHLSLP